MRAFLHFYCLIFLTVVLNGCSSRGVKTTRSNVSQNISESTIRNSKILVLQFDVFKTKNDKDSVMLADARIVSGYLKNDLTDAPTIPAGKVRCTLLDSNEIVLKGVVIDHPLRVALELPPASKEDESHTNTILKREKGGFIIRARYSMDMRYVVVEKSDDHANPEYRVKFDLPII